MIHLSLKNKLYQNKTPTDPCNLI